MKINPNVQDPQTYGLKKLEKTKLLAVQIILILLYMPKDNAA